MRRVRDLIQCLAFWRQCPYHRFMRRPCFCSVSADRRAGA